MGDATKIADNVRFIKINAQGWRFTFRAGVTTESKAWYRLRFLFAAIKLPLFPFPAGTH